MIIILSTAARTHSLKAIKEHLSHIAIQMSVNIRVNSSILSIATNGPLSSTHSLADFLDFSILK